MIKKKIHIHDQYQLELKLSYPIDNHKRNTKFALDFYFIVPDNLQITPPYFDKKDFYHQLKSNIRFRTPRYSIFQIQKKFFIILNPLIERYIQRQTKEISGKIEYHLKMFCSIYKSCLRDAQFVFKEISNEKEFLETFIFYQKQIYKIFEQYKALKSKLNFPAALRLKHTLLKGEEYLLILNEKFYLNILDLSKNIVAHENYAKFYKKIIFLFQKNNAYKRKMEFETVSTKENLYKRSNYLKQESELKKFFSSILFLNLKRTSGSTFQQQVIFALSAGLAMLLGTAGTVYYQSKFGKVTGLVVFIIVFFYIIKDRFKDFMKYYLLVKLKKFIYDQKVKLYADKKTKIGLIREGVWFFDSSGITKKRPKLQDFIRKNFFMDMDIIHYRKTVLLNNKPVTSFYKEYPVSGINDIIRFNVSGFLSKMDNPVKKMIGYDKSKPGFREIETHKTYNIYLMLHFHGKDSTLTDKYRLELDRNGLRSFQKI